MFKLVGADLRARGQEVRSANGEDMSGYQAIRFLPEVAGLFPAAEKPGGPVNGAFVGGSDHRKDGLAIGW